MPRAKLPTNFKGWLAAVSAGLVGFLAGFVWLRQLEKWGF